MANTGTAVVPWVSGVAVPGWGVSFNLRTPVFIVKTGPQAGLVFWSMPTIQYVLNATIAGTLSA